MKTVEHKLHCKFIIHDNEEFEAIYDLIKNRRFAVLEYSEDYRGWFWLEFPNKLINPKNLEFENKYLRVYFNNQHNFDKFRNKMKKRLKPITCGNKDCDSTWCEYHWDNHKPGNLVEYLWRCIREVDYDFTPWIEKEVENGIRI